MLHLARFLLAGISKKAIFADKKIVYAQYPGLFSIQGFYQLSLMTTGFDPESFL